MTKKLSCLTIAMLMIVLLQSSTFAFAPVGISLSFRCREETSDMCSKTTAIATNNTNRNNNWRLAMVGSSNRNSTKRSSKRKKKKPSMAERLRRRQEKSKGDPDPFANVPPANLDFSNSSNNNSGTKGTEEDEEEKETSNEHQQPIRVETPTAAASKAKELLKAQRDSVNMLTRVTERIVERLSDSKFHSELKTQGYSVVDNLLFSGDNEDGNADSTRRTEEEQLLAGELQEEGEYMLHEGDMEVDTTNLGSGEYIVPIVGGEQQYKTCPRLVEIVVAATKHIPEVINNNDADDSLLELDPSVCMATLRTFDRKAYKAAMALLVGNDGDSENESSLSSPPFKVVANNDDKNGDDINDERKLSLYYYIVPDNWESQQCGGGFEFESSGEVIHAKRDRLVVLYSDTTKFRQLQWKGSDGDEFDDNSNAMMIGNSIELHLVNKKK